MAADESIRIILERRGDRWTAAARAHHLTPRRVLGRVVTGRTRSEALEALERVLEEEDVALNEPQDHPA